eukprot:CAMPEP_0168313882 /NCGR_PEP_ID=MMETSP0210-20121227/5121_1 /TAXON_ID=40633 /ORGANISM="Condylostoma magnum, Strain COL2" /LENGTH=70 /DNA_ID=CAMNT_0008276355 /DNA_START=1487 /DNA_END=1699 /DNA_ORIENTATION=-
MQPIKSDLKLDGLIPKYEKLEEYKENPAKKILKKFEFPELDGKVGTFIIDLLGNGRHSRIVVRIGSLKYI